MDGRLTQFARDSADQLSVRARSRRWVEFSRRFPDLAEMRVLDLGGLPPYWRSGRPRPAQVTMVNIASAECDEPWMDLIVGDACDPPPAGTFDLVFSNSLIEHVGGHWRRQQLADVVMRTADHHWIQTPNRYFPIEPHWVAPLMQFLPVRLRAHTAHRWPMSHMRSQGGRGSMRQVLETELLAPAEMAYYFPESELWRERFAGLTKSVVAIRS